MKRNYSEIKRKSGIAYGVASCLCRQSYLRSSQSNEWRGEGENAQRIRCDRMKRRRSVLARYLLAATATAMAKTIVGSLGLQFNDHVYRMRKRLV